MSIVDSPAASVAFEQIGLDFLQQSATIESWFRKQWLQTITPFYSSVDIRNAGFKCAPIDTNLFPGGFNNLSLESGTHMIALQAALESICPTAKTFGLIPENHTRNQFYLRNVATLARMIRQAGFEVLIASVRDDIETAEQTVVDGETLTVHPLERDGDDLYVGGVRPCAFLLNNDLSAGVPDILKACTQPIIPATERGWHVRTKSMHYQAYQRIVADFCVELQIDPWLISSLFDCEQALDFSDAGTLHSLVDKTTTLLGKIEQKYKEYNIDEKPFVVIKADTGTYGMGIISIQEPEEILQLNRKQRKKMLVIKDGMLLDKVLMQEGVPTVECWQEAHNTAEPVLYLINHFVIGGFYRVHADKNARENLNAPGMTFAPMPFELSCQLPNWHAGLRDEHNRLYAYSIIARLATLAASYETTTIKEEI